MDWFLYDNGLRLERLKGLKISFQIPLDGCFCINLGITTKFCFYLLHGRKSVDWFLYDRDLRHERVRGAEALCVEIVTEMKECSRPKDMPNSNVL